MIKLYGCTPDELDEMDSYTIELHRGFKKLENEKELIDQKRREQIKKRR